MANAIDDRKMAIFGAKMYLRQLDAQRDQLDMQRTQLLHDYPEAAEDRDGDPCELQFPRVLGQLPVATPGPATEPEHDLETELVKEARAFQAGASKTIPGTRRTFRESFKKEALARLAKEYASDICRDLDVRESVFRGWAKKAGIKIARMPPEEVHRRMRESHKPHRPPASGATPPPGAPTENTVTDAKRETIQAMLRHGEDGRIHYKELVKHLELEPVSVHYRLGKCFDSHLVKKKGRGVWEVTPKGRQLAAEPA